MKARQSNRKVICFLEHVFSLEFSTAISYSGKLTFQIVLVTTVQFCGAVFTWQA